MTTYDLKRHEYHQPLFISTLPDDLHNYYDLQNKRNEDFHLFSFQKEFSIQFFLYVISGQSYAQIYKRTLSQILDSSSDLSKQFYNYHSDRIHQSASLQLIHYQKYIKQILIYR